MPMTANEVIELLELKPHVQEGGYYRETYQSQQRHGRGALATAIYFLLTPDTRSLLHRLPTDEIYHFYLGDPVELLQLFSDGSSTVSILGHHVEKGQHVQLTIPGGVWQGSRLQSGGQWALFGTTMAPGFRPEDFEAGQRGPLTVAWPSQAELIRNLTSEQD